MLPPIEEEPKEVETTPEEATDPALAKSADGHPFGIAGSMFFADIEKTADAKLGVHFDVMPKVSAPVVISLAPGSIVDAWNQANPDKAVQVDDCLYTVNGDSSKPIDKIAPGGTLQLGFLRPKPITISLQKAEGKPLGLSMSQGSNAIYIMGFMEGGLFEKTALAEGIKAGDRIVSVNGKRESPSAMMQALKDSDSVQLLILSY